MYEGLVLFVQDLYDTDGFIPLHEPRFQGNEKQYLIETIDSTFVSSVGEFVDRFERDIAQYTGAKHAIATVNGTAALHIALKLVGASTGDEVITQSFIFVATCNAIRYCGARPLFVDIDRNTLGLSTESLAEFLKENAEVRADGSCWNKTSNKRIAAVVPMHTFGFPVDLIGINQLCEQYHIPLVEDAAESLGSSLEGKHTGLFGKTAAISFNGNKIITTGGGGMVLTDDEQLAKRAKHLTTTAKLPHAWEFRHDEVAYNYRLPNLNAALGVAQLEKLPDYLSSKRNTAARYQQWGEENGWQFVTEPVNTHSNYWLNAVLLKDREERDAFLSYTNDNGVMTRPAWIPMHQLEINQDCVCADLSVTEEIHQRLVNVPSSVRAE